MNVPKLTSSIPLKQSRIMRPLTNNKSHSSQKEKSLLWGFLLANAAIGITASTIDIGDDKYSKVNDKKLQSNEIFTKNKPYDSQPAWLDLPQDSFSELFGMKLNSKFDEIDELIIGYHEVPKTSVSKISLRIEYLSRINNKLLNLIESESDPSLKKFLTNMHKLTANKKWYLEEILNLYKNGFLDKNFLGNYHNSIDVNGLKYSPMFVKNKIKYYSEFGQFWGAHWLETIDPCHRSLTNLFVQWRKQNDKKNLISFFMWLEGQNLSKEIPYINQLNDEQLRKYTIMVSDGRLYQVNDGKKTLVNYNSPSEEYIFNITLDKKMILMTGSNSIRHTSLSRGKPVLGCGNMVVTDGKITSLGLESGHYQPTLDDGKQLLEILKDMGISLEPNTPFFYYQDGMKHKTDIAGFQQKMQKTSKLSAISN